MVRAPARGAKTVTSVTPASSVCRERSVRTAIRTARASRSERSTSPAVRKLTRVAAVVA